MPPGHHRSTKPAARNGCAHTRTHGITVARTRGLADAWTHANTQARRHANTQARTHACTRARASDGRAGNVLLSEAARTLSPSEMLNLRSKQCVKARLVASQMSALASPRTPRAMRRFQRSRLRARQSADREVRRGANYLSGATLPPQADGRLLAASHHPPSPRNAARLFATPQTPGSSPPLHGLTQRQCPLRRPTPPGNALFRIPLFSRPKHQKFHSHVVAISMSSPLGRNFTTLRGCKLAAASCQLRIRSKALTSRSCAQLRPKQSPPNPTRRACGS